MIKKKADKVNSLTYEELKALEQAHERITSLLHETFPPGKEVVFKTYSNYRVKGQVTRYHPAKVVEARFNDSKIEVVVFHNEKAKPIPLHRFHIPNADQLEDELSYGL